MKYVKKEGQGTLFKYKWLEVFTKTNPLIHLVTYGLAAAIFLYLNELDVQTTTWLFLLGAFAWTFVEYIIHRFLFHIKESNFQYVIHGVHHEYPRDKERLMMPPLPGAVLVLTFYAFWYVLLRDFAPAFMSGFIIGYMLYTFIHYMVHAFKPVKPIKFFWAHHHKHHNPMYENKAFGVSTDLWDRVFGTMPR
jgi:sterol desaturase/sphingolipid hydroxylase (fatty acid hydroxylase superfamily)